MSADRFRAWTPALIFLLFALLISGLGLFVFQQHARHLRQSAQQGLAAIADLKAGQIARWCSERKADAEAASQDRFFEDTVAAWLQADAPPDTRRQRLLERLTVLQNAYEYHSVDLLDDQGASRLSTSGAPPTVSAAAHGLALAAMRSGEVLLSDFYRAEAETGRPIRLGLFAPLLGSNGQAIGVLFFRIDPGRFLFPLIQFWPSSSPTAETLLVRREGDDVVFLNELRHRKQVALALRRPVIEKTLPASMAAQGYEGQIEGVDYRGVPVLAATRSISDSPWFIVAKVDLDEVYAPVRERALLIAESTVAFIALAGVLTALWWRHQRTRALLSEYEVRLAAEERNRQLAAIVESCDDAIYIKTLDGVIRSWNKAAEAIYGYAESEAIGQPVSLLVPEGHEDDVPHLLEQIRRGGHVVHFETVRRRKDGSNIYVSLSISPLRDQEGKVIAATSIARDITERELAEERLRATSIYTRSLIEASLDPLVTISAEGKITDVNHAAMEATGIPRARLIGSDFCDYFTDPDKARAGYLEVFEKGFVTNYPLAVRHASGKIMDVLYNASVYRDEKGNVAGVFAAARDVTERKQAEAAVLAERQRFYEVLNTLPVYLILLSPDYRVPFANRYFEQRFGESHGQRCYEYLFHRTEPCHICETFKVLKTLQPLEWEWKGPDGRDYYIYDFPFTDTDGSTLIMETGIDITEQKQAQAALRELNETLKAERQRFYDVLETLPVMICLLTPDYHVAFANRSFRERFGESGGRPCYEYVWGFPEPCEFSESFKVLETGEPHYWQVTAPDGTVIDCYDFPFTDVDGSPLVLEMDIDVTEQKRAEAEIKRLNAELEQRVVERTAELEAANHELEAFSYSVSHDLRTPLRAIDGFSNMLMKRFAGRLDDEGKRLVQVVRDNTAKMAQLIDDILAFSRAGRLELRASAIDMEAMVRAVWEELEPARAERHVRLTVQSLASALGDAATLRQVWVNLLDNAVKFTRPKDVAEVEVGSMVEGDECRYYVKDNGVGFDQAYVHKLFGVFQRLHGVDEFEGTGIGLAIVKRIVVRHGGRVWAEGKVDEGANVCFTLPRKEI